MRIAIAVFLALFVAWSGSALAHGDKKHQKAAVPERASTKTPDEKPDMDMKKEETEAHEGHDNSDGHHDKTKEDGGESAMSQRQTDKIKDQKMAVEAAQHRANEAVSALKYRATFMVFGFMVLCAGLVARYLPGKGKADAS
ncbi:Probable Co/Zn/Cd efflux system membrane fusion protein [hydrothermal vent metagenome]|uniref:Probable Co/Zn/Cd efflux system membrane fusion protein n=1 Tax=hydrothermal vent metagenome TaxID=652676 RepID=A0A3B1BJF7_9ZZZZ